MEKFGICLYSNIPGRESGSDKSEMTTQLLFGDSYQVLDDTTVKNWVLIRCSYDNYECWIDRGLHTEISVSEFENWNKTATETTTELFTQITNETTGITYPILRGASYPQEKFQIEGNTFSLVAKNNDATASQSPLQKLRTYVTSYLNVPYLWGGKSPFGLDCSGFTQIIFKQLGIKIPRDSYQQAEIGTEVPFVSEARTGDLAFFENAEGRIIHVGIVLEEGLIIHASSFVKIGKLDHEGIFDLTQKRYTHKLRIVKRIL